MQSKGLRIVRKVLKIHTVGELILPDGDLS